MVSRSSVLFCAVMILATVVVPLAAQDSATIKRGSYLVNDVAGCGDCHSPRLPHGEPDKSHWLEGATLFFAPVQAVPHWVKQSPNIAGLKDWKAEDVQKLLETGAFPNGRRPNPPMPAYHMTPRDAKAVVAYLKSLGRTQ